MVSGVYSPTDEMIPRINACNVFPNSLEAFVVFRTHSMLYELADLAIRSRRSEHLLRGIPTQPGTHSKVCHVHQI